MTLFTLDALHAARDLVHRHMPPTPQYAWPLLAERLGTELWVKHENHTPTGAFKVRGGLVYLDELARSQPDCPGIVTATRGNHGQSIPFAARAFNVPVDGAGAGRQLGREKRRHEAPGAPIWSSLAGISKTPGWRPSDAERKTACTSSARSTNRWSRGVATYALELFTAVPGSGRRLCAHRHGLGHAAA